MKPQKNNSLNRFMRVMSFNIRYDAPSDYPQNHWVKRRPYVAEIIKESQSDFVGIQESLNSQRSYLESQLEDYSSYGRTREESEEYGESCPIFYLHSKWKQVAGDVFWFSDEPKKPGSKGWGNTLPRIATWGVFRNILEEDNQLEVREFVKEKSKF